MDASFDFNAQLLMRIADFAFQSETSLITCHRLMRTLDWGI